MANYFDPRQIVYMDAEEFAASSLLRRFQAGAAVVVVKNEKLAKSAWDSLVEKPRAIGKQVAAEILPWQGSLRDLAANFQQQLPLQREIGDLFYNQPDKLNYIARKLELSLDGASGTIRSNPVEFSCGGARYALDQNGLRHAWRLGEKLKSGFGLPIRLGPLMVHRLFYEACIKDLTRRRQLIAKSIMSPKEHELSCEAPTAIPAGRVLPHKLNKIARLLRRVVSDDAKHGFTDQLNGRAGNTIVGEPHTDGRLFSALISVRGSHVTEVSLGGRWLEIPFERHNLAILPGRGAEAAFGVKPVVHRVVNTSSASNGGDITLLLGM